MEKDTLKIPIAALKLLVLLMIFFLDDVYYDFLYVTVDFI